MRIKGFTFMVKDHLQFEKLNNTEVVIDGQNIFYSLYKVSGIQFVLGSESDRYADYLRDYFQMFKKANLKCHIIIKGGHETEETLGIHFKARTRIHGKSFSLGQNYEGQIIQPCLAKDIFMEVLTEMELDFTVCYTNDVIGECIALARRLSCPVVGFNIQYCFSAARYLPMEPGVKFRMDRDNNAICGIFSREKFIKSYNISTEKLMIFILLVDTDIFEENILLNSLKAAKIPLSYGKRYNSILSWLSRKSRFEVVNHIFQYISKSDQNKFLEKESVLKEKFLSLEDKESLSTLYFTDRDRVQVEESDPLWFEKGIALKHIAIPYINLYNWSIVKASNLIEDYEQPNSIMIAVDILKYAHDLLKNFSGDEITIRKRDEYLDEDDAIVKYSQLVSKPEINSKGCVFENGWDNIESRRLFEHLFLEIFKSFNFEALEGAPEDARLLLIALVYFAKKKGSDFNSEIHSFIVSYVMLGVVGEKADRNVKTSYKEKDDKPDDKPILDSTIDKASVEVHDCEIANAVIGKYFSVSRSELHDIFDRKKLHPLIEFERCLQEINHLNRLCGCPFTPTIFSKTYNGTFVYKFLCSMEDGDPLEFIKEKMNPAPTVLAFTLGMIEKYERMLYEY